MNQNKCNAIENYLKEQFPNSNIEQANISDNQHYRIPTENGLLILKVGKEFIDDSTEEEIIQKLNEWEVPSLLRENSKLGILVTRYGASTFQR